MAKVIVTMKIMPSDPEVNLADVEQGLREVVASEGGAMLSVEKQPIGFGLVALIVKFSMDESKGTDDVEALFVKVAGVESAQTTMTSRALG